MPLSSRESKALADSAIASLRRGDAAAARTAFSRLAAEGVADASVQLGLAYACHALGDHAAALAAADAALAVEPRNIRALMFKADHLHAAGNAGAAPYYQAVLKCAPPAAQLPSDLQQLVARAQAMSEHYAQSFESSVRDHLASVARRTGAATPRFAQSMELLAGRKQIYHQAPLLYYFPELPHVQFFNRADFPWLDKLEAATDDIRQECLAVMSDPAAFSPYVQRDRLRPTLNQGGMLDNPEWSAFYLWKHGQLVAENAARCPRTMSALAEAPLTQMPGRSPSVLFSLLRPGARIPAHHGFVNTRLIVHLPLVVPPGCGFRVGNETREWVEGKAWLFDDTIEHEAWNTSDRTRVILLFETWRPELTEAERAQVSALFEAIDRLRGGLADWSI